ncbi:MAG: O-antigen ligase family protein [Bacteroidales bacterium]
MISAIVSRQIAPKLTESKSACIGISALCFIQACYGTLQYFGCLHSIQSGFDVVGSFDNPAGFAAVLAIGFPVGLSLLAKNKGAWQYVVGIMLAVIVIAIILSEFRSGLLAVVLSALAFGLFLHYKKVRKSLTKSYAKCVAVILAVGFAFGAFALYRQKPHSANGRLLIWKVSTDMIKDKPLLGHGYNSFQAKYMDYQASYFKAKPNSKYALLADNVKHPFNEFIKLAVEFGLVTLILVILAIALIVKRALRVDENGSALIITGLTTIAVFSCFSYPFQYTATYLLLAFYLSALLPKGKITLPYTPRAIFARCAVILSCAFLIFTASRWLYYELRWKTIADSSLRGNTEMMLPKYEELYHTSFRQKPLFLYNYGAELNYVHKHEESNKILLECAVKFNDYDLQMLMADNYMSLENFKQAEQTLKHASCMIPNRFYPLFKLVELYRNTDQTDKAQTLAKEILEKQVKIPSPTISYIKQKRLYVECSG